MKKYILACGILGVMSLFFFVLTNLALFDISRGEADVANEWRAVKVGVFPILVFHVAAIVGLFKVAHRLEERG